MKTPDEIDTFIRDMLKAKQLSGVDDDVRDQLVQDMREKLLSLVDRAVIDALPNDKVDILNELLDRNATEEEVQTLIRDSGVDVRQITIDTMLKFRSLYIQEEQVGE